MRPARLVVYFEGIKLKLFTVYLFALYGIIFAGATLFFESIKHSGGKSDRVIFFKINSLFFGFVRSRYIFEPAKTVILLLEEVRASSYEPRYRDGSDSGVNFAVCSFRNFQPGYRDVK